MSGKWRCLVCVHRYYLNSLAGPQPTVVVVCNADNESVLLIATVNNNNRQHADKYCHSHYIRSLDGLSSRYRFVILGKK